MDLPCAWFFILTSFFARIFILAIFAFMQSVFIKLVVCGILIIPVIILTAIVRPYRESVYNFIDLFFFLTFVQLCFSTSSTALITLDQSYPFIITIIGISIFIPICYIILLAVYKLLPSTCIICIKERVLRIFNHH